MAAMGDSVFITCAITGAGDTVAKSDKVLVTPSEIAASSIEAAKAGAAVVHIHVRDPETWAPHRASPPRPPAAAGDGRSG